MAETWASDIEIIFEDENILAVNKPAGLSVITEGWDPNAPFLLNILSKNHKKLWVVHRLDKPTSGAVLFAKNPEAHRSLNIQFEHHLVKKVYHAIVEGSPEWTSITSEQPLRTNADRSHRTVVDFKSGKPSVTSFHLLDTKDKFSLIEAYPKSGRTHQIRAHAANIGLPILGDSLYGGHKNKNITRIALHSYSITFNNFEMNRQEKIIASYPLDFTNALLLLGFLPQK